MIDVELPQELGEKLEALYAADPEGLVKGLEKGLEGQ